MPSYHSSLEIKTKINNMIMKFCHLKTEAESTPEASWECMKYTSGTGKFPT
jgi:hypothetical protein